MTFHESFLLLEEFLHLNKCYLVTSPPRCINGNQQIAWGQPDKMLGGNLRWTSIPSRGSRNTSSRFILQKPEISAGTDEPSRSYNYDWGILFHNRHICSPRRDTNMASPYKALSIWLKHFSEYFMYEKLLRSKSWQVFFIR